MKIEVNISKTKFFVMLGVVLVLAGVIAVYATHVPNTAVPSHPINEITGTPTCSPGQALTHNASGWSCITSGGMPTISIHYVSSGGSGNTIALGAHDICFPYGHTGTDTDTSETATCRTVNSTANPATWTWSAFAKYANCNVMCLDW